MSFCFFVDIRETVPFNAPIKIQNRVGGVKTPPYADWAIHETWFHSLHRKIKNLSTHNRLRDKYAPQQQKKNGTWPPQQNSCIR